MIAVYPDLKLLLAAAFTDAFGKVSLSIWVRAGFPVRMDVEELQTAAKTPSRCLMRLMLLYTACTSPNAACG